MSFYSFSTNVWGDDLFLNLPSEAGKWRRFWVLGMGEISVKILGEDM